MKEGINLHKAIQKLDEVETTDIFDLYSSAIFNYVLRLCGDSLVADQLTGDVFANLLEQIAGGKGPRKNLRSYLYQTAYHLVVDRSRDSKLNAPLEVALAGHDPRYNVDQHIEEKIFMELTVNAMKKDLTEVQRHVIILRFLEDFSLRETAEILGKEVNHIKVIQSRGIAKLRKVMGVKT